MNKDFIYLALLVGVIVFFYLFPNKEIKIDTKYLPGDTITLRDTVTERDTVTYTEKAKKDTVYDLDTVYLAYSSPFELGDSVLGTTGTVVFALDEFTFKDIEYTYPEITKLVVDTLKETRTVHPPMYDDVWFWTTSLALVLLVLSLSGG